MAKGDTSPKKSKAASKGPKGGAEKKAKKEKDPNAPKVRSTARNNSCVQRWTRLLAILASNRHQDLKDLAQPEDLWMCESLTKSRWYVYDLERTFSALYLRVPVPSASNRIHTI